MQKIFSLLLLVILVNLSSCKDSWPEKPNFLFMIADDWGWPHSPMYGDPVVKTPTFDRLASEGILFEHAYVSSPSCTPSRNAILTGQYHWRLKEGANLWSTLDVNIPVYPLLLEKAGYFTGHWRKCWGPGDLSAGGYTDTYPGGPAFDGFADFLNQRPAGQPFCFWLGASDPHRGYQLNSGLESGIDASRIQVPGFYPDDDRIRADIADYYFEVQRFDSDCGEAIRLLEESGELDHTVILMTGDNGFPFPRAKSNLYDMGIHQPLAVRWGEVVKPGRQVSDFISFTDFAPTFLELAGVDVPEVMTGHSFTNILLSGGSGQIDNARLQVIAGKERHVPAQQAPDMSGYPCRTIKTHQWQYIYNFRPDLWPAGVPEGATHPSGRFADCDGGPTKEVIMALTNDSLGRKYYDWCFGFRPQEELYDLIRDPFQLTNLASNPEFAQIKDQLKASLFEALEKTGDPRVTGKGSDFSAYPYRTNYALNTR